MSSDMPYWAVIPATGSGMRMRADRPKQYLSLSGKTILEHTLDNLLAYPPISGAVVILHQQDEYWSRLGYQHQKPLLIAHGGEHRHHSVYNGLQLLHEYLHGDSYVLIHDAVRPFVRHQDLDKLIQILGETEDGALLAAPVTDTLKMANGQNQVDRTIPREGLWRAFTPQAFRLQLIKQALEQVIENNQQVTDDASAMEMAGFHPHLVESDSMNIKITHPDDLEFARWLARQDHKISS